MGGMGMMNPMMMGGYVSHRQRVCVESLPCASPRSLEVASPLGTAQLQAKDNPFGMNEADGRA